MPTGLIGFKIRRVSLNFFINVYQVDVIVNTTNANLNLNGSACGTALLKVAGKQLSDECQKIGRLKVGNIATTGSANLNCKRVYHVCCSSWDGGKGVLVMPIKLNPSYYFFISVLYILLIHIIIYFFIDSPSAYQNVFATS